MRFEKPANHLDPQFCLWSKGQTIPTKVLGLKVLTKFEDNIDGPDGNWIIQYEIADRIQEWIVKDFLCCQQRHLMYIVTDVTDILVSQTNYPHQPKFHFNGCNKDHLQFFQKIIHDSWCLWCKNRWKFHKARAVTRYILGYVFDFFPNKPLSSYLWCPMMEANF